MLINMITLGILILVNAYFAATEIAFISLNDAKIERQAKEGNKKAKLIEKMLNSPSKFLATIQIGITLAGFLSSAFASETFAQMLAPIINSWFPTINIEVFKTISIIVVTIILSYFTLIFGELVPKRLGMKYYEKIAYGTVRIIQIIAMIMAPFVKILTVSTNLISKLFGITEQDEEIVTEEEIKMMIEEGEEKGTIEQAEKEMINNIFQFNDITVSEVMTHRTNVYAVDMNANIDSLLEEMDEYKYSRIPVYDETIDNIEGIVYLKDVIKYLKETKQNKADTRKIKTIMKEIYFVSESKPINTLFKELQKSKQQMAVVIDEYGGTAGIVTMEDLIEEIVGNIFDEYDEIELDYEQLDSNTYRINGSVSIYELRKILKIPIPEGDYETLSGYLLELLGRIPEEEEKPIIETEKVIYKVEKYEEKRIISVKACKNLQEIKQEG